MRGFLRPFFAFLALSICITALPALAHDPEEIPGLVDRVIDAVVTISVVGTTNANESVQQPQVPESFLEDPIFKKFFGQEENEGAKTGEEGKEGSEKVRTAGSGFVIDPAGLIVTNNHVVKDAKQIAVTLNDGSRLEVEKIVGTDIKTDLAILKVKPQNPLVSITFGDSTKVRVGQTIVAIGSPFGLAGSVTSGIVSALNRDINIGPYDDYIQIDAALNRGNAGGPLFNLMGEVIGVNSAIVSPTGSSIGVGFAIPANSARVVIDQLKKYGETRRGWLGVQIQNVTDELATSLNMKTPGGALVASVTPGGPADRGGIEVGDIILAFDGREILNMHVLSPIVADTEIGKNVDVQILRKGKWRMVKVGIGHLPETPAAKGDQENGAISSGEDAAGEVPDTQPDMQGLGKLK